MVSRIGSRSLGPAAVRKVIALTTQRVGARARRVSLGPVPACQPIPSVRVARSGIDLGPTGGYFLGDSDVEFEEVFMSFVFMVLHWPEPGRGEALAAGMREMRDLLLAKPGCVGVEPPYLTEDGSCLVGISKWESADAFHASGITLRPS